MQTSRQCGVMIQLQCTGVKPWSQIPLYIVPDSAATEHNDVTMMSVNMFLFSQHRNWAVAGAGQSWAAGLNKSISDGLVAGGEGGMRAPDIRAVEQWTGLVIYPDLEIAQLPPAAAAGNTATKRRHQHHNNNTNNSNSSHPRWSSLASPLTCS